MALDVPAYVEEDCENDGLDSVMQAWVALGIELEPKQTRNSSALARARTANGGPELPASPVHNSRALSAIQNFLQARRNPRSSPRAKQRLFLNDALAAEAVAESAEASSPIGAGLFDDLDDE